MAVPFAGVSAGVWLFWPAGGLLIAVLHHANRDQWPILLVLAAMGSGIVTVAQGGSPALVAAATLAYPAEAWLATRLLKRRKRNGAELLREWLADAGATGVIAPLAAGMVFATVLAQFSPLGWVSPFRQYFFGHALGNLVFFPFFSMVVGGSFGRWLERQTAGRRWELLAFQLLLVVTSCAAMWQDAYPAYLVPLLVALIASLRFGMPAGSLSVFVTGVTVWAVLAAGAFAGTVFPFAVGDTQFLQFYLALSVICLQPLAGHITQNRQLTNALRKRSQSGDGFKLSVEARDFALHESRDMYRLLAENMTDVIIKTDKEGFILYASPSAGVLGQAHPIELMGKHMLDMIHPSYGASFQSSFSAVMEEKEECSGWSEYLGCSTEGEDKWFDTKISAWYDDTGELSGGVITLRNIAERKALEKQLFAATLTDPLTNLTNRRAFNSMLQYHLDAPIDGCLAIFDIDNFRGINREYGHEVGDNVLTTVAKLLRSLMRKDDIISRIGGERFAVLLSRATPDQAEALCQRVVLTLAEMSGPEGVDGPRATVSAGIARIKTTLDDTMTRADAAVVVAKAKGRNRLEMEAGSQARLRWSPGAVPWLE